MNIVIPKCQIYIEFEELNIKSCNFVLWFEELRKKFKRYSQTDCEGRPLKTSEKLVEVTKNK